MSNLTQILTEHLRIHPWLVLAIVGFALFVGSNKLFGKPLASAHGLVVPLLIGVVIEAFQIWHHYGPSGLPASNGVALMAIVFRHAIDVGVMVFLPAVVSVGDAIAQLRHARAKSRITRR